MMRIDRLDLIRYGAFKDRSLTFDPNARVTIVYGPNEAGKSTALAALGDLLFGFPLRSAAAFRFKTSELRLGGAIRGADGAELSFHRRKGAKAVLRAPEDDRPLPDDALAPFLGGLSEEAFKQLFALDAERLRDGGLQLLENGGELGETLLNASGAIANAEQLRAGLALRASELFNPARKAGKLPLYDAFGRYLEARKEFETARVTAREADAARAAAQEAATHLTAAREAKQAVDDAAALAARAQLAAPRFRDLEKAKAALVEFAALSGAPAGKAEVLAQLAREVEDAAQEANTAQEHYAGALKQRDAAPQPGPLLRERAAMEALAPLRTLAEEAIRNQPSLEASRAEAETACGSAARRLGAARENLGASQLSDAESVELSRVIARGRDLVARQDTDVSLPSDRLDEAAKLLRQLRDVGGLFERASEARTQALKSQRAVSEKLAALSCYAGSAADLAAFAPPSEQEIERFGASLTALEAEHARARAKAEERDAEKSTLVAQLEAEVAAPPSDEEIAKVREARDSEWRRIRAEKFEGRQSGAPASPELFETRVRAADDLADRRSAEAQRAERIASSRRKLTDLEAETARAAQEAEMRKKKCATLKQAWVDAWKGLPRPPERPSMMKDWPMRRLDILKAAQESEAATAAADRAEKALSDSLAAVTQLGVLLEDPVSQPADAREAGDILDRWRLREAGARRFAEIGADLSAWRKDRERWSARLTLPETQSDEGWLEAAEAAAKAAEQAPRALADLHRAEAAMREAQAQLDAFLTAFSAVASRVVDASRPPEKVGDPVAALETARQWAEALKEEEQRAQRLEQFELQLDVAEKSLARETATLERKRTVLEQEAAALGADASGITELVERLAARDKAAETLVLAERALLEVVGGRDLSEVETAIAGRDDDALARDADEKKHLAVAAAEDYDAAVRTDEAAKMQVLALQSDRGASRAARAMEAASAEGGDLAEEWLRLRAGDLLLAEAIRRYREKTSNPMLERASSAFAQLTGGSFEALGIRFGDDGEERIVGLRPSGDAVEPAGMSEGARDQLFLALRIAAIERWSESRTAAPFVGDDLLASFDDDRAGAAFKALAELGRSTQVLLFTHHRHMLDIARSAIGDGLSVVRLDEA